MRLEEYGYGNGKVTPWNTIQPVDQNGVVLFKIIEYEGGVEWIYHIWDIHSKSGGGLEKYKG